MGVSGWPAPLPEDRQCVAIGRAAVPVWGGVKVEIGHKA